MTNLGQLIQFGVNHLQKVGIPDAGKEPLFFISEVLRISPGKVPLFLDQPATSDISEKFNEFIRGREERRPLDYITGVSYFRDFKLRVNSDVLIPRPETEELVEHCIHFLSKRPHPLQILDIGTGSGCIAISLKKAFPKAAVLATDISPAALTLARQNAVASGAAKIEFFMGNQFDPLESKYENSFDLVVSNPPYLSHADLAVMQPELQYEPKLALDGGTDGLDSIRSLVQSSKRFLKPNGALYIEIGFNQGSAVLDLFNRNGFRQPEILKDLSGQDRIAKGDFDGSI